MSFSQDKRGEEVCQSSDGAVYVAVPQKSKSKQKYKFLNADFSKQFSYPYFSRIFFSNNIYEGGVVETPLRIINMEDPVTLHLLPMYIYGCPVFIDSKMYDVIKWAYPRKLINCHFVCKI